MRKPKPSRASGELKPSDSREKEWHLDEIYAGGTRILDGLNTPIHIRIIPDGTATNIMEAHNNALRAEQKPEAKNLEER